MTSVFRFSIICQSFVVISDYSYVIFFLSKCSPPENILEHYIAISSQCEYEMNLTNIKLNLYITNMMQGDADCLNFVL